MRIFLALDHYCPGISLRSTVLDEADSVCSAVVSAVELPRLLSNKAQELGDKAQELGDTAQNLGDTAQNLGDMATDAWNALQNGISGAQGN